MDIDKAKAEEEKAKIVEKIFQCSETPIKEWISLFINDYVKVNIEELFPDYVDDSDVIAYEDNKKHYTAYLVTMPHDAVSFVDTELLKLENTQKACSMLYDGVRMVFPAVVQTINEEYKKYVDGIIVSFNNEKMSFTLTKVNIKKFKFEKAKEQMELLIKFKENTSNPDELKQINELLMKSEDLIKSISIDDIVDEQKLCDEINEKLKNADQLHIAIEENSESVELMEAALHRLPTIGVSYQDPDEETLVDKLKKEHGIN
jgi:hypothetical protein